MTISASFSGPRSFSSRRAAACSDSYCPPRRKSVVVALPRSAPLSRTAIATTATQAPMVSQGLRALILASISVKGATSAPFGMLGAFY